MAFIDARLEQAAAAIGPARDPQADVQWVVESTRFLAALTSGVWEPLRPPQIFATGVVASPTPPWCGLAPNILQLIIARVSKNRRSVACPRQPRSDQR